MIARLWLWVARRLCPDSAVRWHPLDTEPEPIKDWGLRMEDRDA